MELSSDLVNFIQRKEIDIKCTANRKGISGWWKDESIYLQIVIIYKVKNIKTSINKLINFTNQLVFLQWQGLSSRI